MCVLCVRARVCVRVCLWHCRYSVIAAQEVGGNKLVKLRNPWGQGEWKGRWSDGSPEWTDEIKAALGSAESAADGQFWMDFNDFLMCFNLLSVVSMEPSWAPQTGQ